MRKGQMIRFPLNLALAQNFNTRKLIFLLIASIWIGTFMYIPYHDASASLIDDLFGLFKNKGGDKGNTGSTTQDFKVYENTSAGLATQYPSSWKVNSTHDPEDPGLVTTFNGPKGEIVELAVDPMGNKTLTLNQAADDAITYYQNSSKDFKLLQLNTDFTLAGKPAYKLEYISRDPDTKGIFKSMEVTTILQNKEYSISYLADPDTYSTSLPLVQKIINSFKITS
jgi:hypothetical protein